MITSLMLGVVLVALVVMRPRLALWIGLFFPAVQAFYPLTFLRLVVLSVLSVGLLLGWRHASRRQTDVVTYLWLGVVVTLLIGWLLAPDPSRAQGMVVNLLYATMVASLAVVYRMSALEWNVCAMAWGILVSAWLMTHDIVSTGRTGSLYIGENANSLGMFAALGFVGALGLAAGREFRVARLSVGTSVALFCALGVVSAASRGALLVAAVGAGILIVAPALRRSRMRALLAMAVLAAVTTWLAVPVLSWFLTRAGRNVDATTNFDAREKIIREGLQAGLQHPLSGVGFGNIQVSDIGVFGLVSAHNAYVGLLAATGVLPVVLLGVLILSALSRARVSREGNLLPLLASALVIGLSLDWLPTAKLGALVLALLSCAAALPKHPVNDQATDRSNAAPPGRHGGDRLEIGL